MSDASLSWQRARPDVQSLTGRYVTVARLVPSADIDDLYELSHRTEEYRALWRYLWNGPFESRTHMRAWLDSVAAASDPMFYTVRSHELGRSVGMFSLLNIVPDMARLEFGHIWYSPLVQRTKVNTEVTYVFLRYVFDDLRYRRVEWKCDNLNERSKRTALRMGFKYEGLFRKHMIVKGQNRDTAWFSMLDDEWPALRANFERYLSGAAASLTELNKA